MYAPQLIKTCFTHHRIAIIGFRSFCLRRYTTTQHHIPPTRLAFGANHRAPLLALSPTTRPVMITLALSTSHAGSGARNFANFSILPLRLSLYHCNHERSPVSLLCYYAASVGAWDMGNMHVHHSICDCGVAGYFWMASQPGGYYRIPQYCFSINDLISRSYTHSTLCLLLRIST
jgi:hypothetical protein